ncbi:MAG TPA: hypothetical protein VET85_07075 [Stellaceae bacterium]|nr:hypothetical protein [Stellaceae bacterium]
MILSAAEHAITIDQMLRRRPVLPAAPAARRTTAPEARQRTAPGLLQRFLRAPEPTVFQRCLAVHMHFAEHAGALDRDDLPEDDLQ